MAFSLTPLPLAKQARMLAAAMSTGATWAAKNTPGTNVYKFLLGISAELVRLEATAEAIANDFDITQTVVLLERWEESVGIPDLCFDRTGTVEQRRQNVIVKLTHMRHIITREQFIELAAALGFTVTIRSGTEGSALFPLLFPAPFAAAQGRFVMVVSVSGVSAEFFPLLFPAQFSASAAQVLQCVMGVISPINVQPVFEYT